MRLARPDGLIGSRRWSLGRTAARPAGARRSRPEALLAQRQRTSGGGQARSPGHRLTVAGTATGCDPAGAMPAVVRQRIAAVPRLSGQAAGGPARAHRRHPAYRRAARGRRLARRAHPRRDHGLAAGAAVRAGLRRDGPRAARAGTELCRSLSSHHLGEPAAAARPRDRGGAPRCGAHRHGAGRRFAGGVEPGADAAAGGCRQAVTTAARAVAVPGGAAQLPAVAALAELSENDARGLDHPGGAAQSTRGRLSVRGAPDGRSRDVGTIRSEAGGRERRSRWVAPTRRGQIGRCTVERNPPGGGVLVQRLASPP